MIVLFFCWMAAKSGTGLIIISVLYGIASGGFSSLQAPLITRTAVDMRFAGTMVGQMFGRCPFQTGTSMPQPKTDSSVFQAFAQLVGPPIAGALFGHGSREEQLRHFPRLIILGGLLFVVSTTALRLARLRQNRNWRAVL
jgi:MFS family permease